MRGKSFEQLAIVAVLDETLTGVVKFEQAEVGCVASIEAGLFAKRKASTDDG